VKFSPRVRSGCGRHVSRGGRGCGARSGWPKTGVRFVDQGLDKRLFGVQIDGLAAFRVLVFGRELGLQLRELSGLARFAPQKGIFQSAQAFEVLVELFERWHGSF